MEDGASGGGREREGGGREVVGKEGAGKGCYEGCGGAETSFVGILEADIEVCETLSA